MNFPKISVVTPSYNQGKYLEQTILSVLSQDYPNVEYIIIDGGSTDGSVEIIKKYQHRLHYWESEKDKGFGHALNKGFAKATGEILCWLNSDDILLPGALDIVGRFFGKFPDVGVVTGDRWYIDESSVMLFKTRYYFYLPGQFKFTKTLAQEATFWRKEVFSKAGGYIDEQLRFVIDFDLWCRLGKVTTFRHIPFFLGGFRVQPESKSSTIIDVGREERKKTIAKYYDKYPSEFSLSVFLFLLTNLRRLYRICGLENLKVLFYKKVLNTGRTADGF